MAKIEEEILQRLKKAEESIETIELGVYGDAKNQIKGLIQTVKEILKDNESLRKDLKSLQDERKKIIAFASGALVVIEGIVQLVKWKFH